MVKIIILVLIIFPALSNALTYGAYRTFAQGGARSLSLGGAFAAIENDASSVWIAPAMIPLTNSELDVVFTQGQAFSQEPVPQSNTQTVLKSAYETYTVSYTYDKKASVSFGIGTPFSEGPDNPIFLNSSLVLNETRVTPGYKFFDRLSFAPLILIRTVTEKYNNFLDPSSNVVGAESSSSAIDIGLSAGLRLSPTILGCLAWEPPRTFNISNPAGLTAVGNGFAPVKIPSITRLGFSFKIPDLKVLISTQMDWWSDASGLSSFIDSQYNSVQTFSVNNSLFVPRLGIEHQFIDRFWARSWIRTGFYEEQPRVVQQPPRDHWTLGVESRVWILDFNFAYDSAPGYSNAAASLGLSLGDYL